MNKKRRNIIIMFMIILLIFFASSFLNKNNIDEYNKHLLDMKNNEKIINEVKKAENYNEEIRKKKIKYDNLENEINIGIKELDIDKKNINNILELFEEEEGFSFSDSHPEEMSVSLFKMEIEYNNKKTDLNPILIIKDAETNELIKYKDNFIIARASPISYERNENVSISTLAVLKENKEQKICLEFANENEVSLICE